MMVFNVFRQLDKKKRRTFLHGNQVEFKIKKEVMMNDQVLQTFLERAAEKALQEIKEDGNISEKNTIPLILKAQLNHILRLDQDMVTKEEFKNTLDKIVTKEAFHQSFDKMVTKEEFNFFRNDFKKSQSQIITILTLGIAFISLLITMTKFF